MRYILACICSVIGGSLLIASTFGKDKKNLLKFQIIETAFDTLANVLFIAYSGAVMNGMAFIRNCINYKYKLKRWQLILMVTVIGTISLAVNNRGLVGIILTLVTVQYSIAICFVENMTFMFINMIINNAVWATYNFATRNYIGTVLSACVIIFSIVNMVRKRKANAEQGGESENAKLP